MTHTLHRRVFLEDVGQDFTLLCMAAQGFNEEGSGEKLKKIYSLVAAANPDNLADDNLGGRFTGYTDEQILSQVDAMLEENPEEKILTFACNWCSYAGADYAGVSRLQYPTNTRLIRTMCSGRVDESFIWQGFQKGAPIILVSGCHIGDCHYIDANHWTERRIGKVRKKMEKLGIRPERLQLEWISAAEGIRFAEVMKKIEMCWVFLM